MGQNTFKAQHVRQAGAGLAFLGGGVNDVGELAERRGDDLADEAASAHVLAGRLALPLALAHGVQDHLRVVWHAAHQLQRVEVRARPAQPSQVDQQSRVNARKPCLTVLEFAPFIMIRLLAFGSPTGTLPASQHAEEEIHDLAMTAADP